MIPARLWEIARCIAFWCCVAVLCLWGWDREPPFALLSYQVQPVKRGGYLLIEGKVRRDVARNCSVTFSRYFFDARGFRWGLGEPQTMSAAGIKKMDSMFPGELRLLVPVPEGMAPGVGKYITDLSYECNPLHQAFPINVLMEVDFEVRP